MHRKPQRKPIVLVIGVALAVVVIAGGTAFAFRQRLAILFEEQNQAGLQKNERVEQAEYGSPSQGNRNATTPVTATGAILLNNIPEKYDLKMEFHPQAPGGVWDQSHEEFCEEASVQLVLNYFEKRQQTDEEFDKELLNIQKKEQEILNGTWESTTVAQMKAVIEKNWPGYNVQILENPTEQDIQRYIASKIPVILPLAGREIGNPFYQQPGPVYHMLVVKGYTKTHFITNDVGTKRGKDFYYKKDKLMSSIHDWNVTDIGKGEKRALVIFPKK